MLVLEVDDTAAGLFDVVRFVGVAAGVVELLVVRDAEPCAGLAPLGQHCPIRQVGNRQSVAVELARFTDPLTAHVQRRHDQRAAAVALSHDACPVEPHSGLAESGAGEDCEAFTLDGPAHDPRLVIEEIGARFHHDGVEAGRLADQFQIGGVELHRCLADESVIGQRADSE